jgi:HD-GYP domain-containing protein (c-di-GMP phosphodiesterase class II)
MLVSGWIEKEAIVVSLCFIFSAAAIHATTDSPIYSTPQIWYSLLAIAVYRFFKLMQHDTTGSSDIRLAELMAALSLATDLGMGQPLEWALCACVLAVRLGDTLGLSEEQLREVYYQALLRYIGCNAETHMLAAVVGDEIALRNDLATVDNGNQVQVISLIARYISQANAGASALQLAQEIMRGVLATGRNIKDFFTGHCEVAQRLAERLGFGEPIVQALGQLYARWDGKGIPALKGEAIALSVRIVTLAQDAVTFHRLSGADAAVAVARQRAGGAYDPHMVERFCQVAPRLLAGLEDEPSWNMVLGIEPGPRLYLSEAQFDSACRAMADFADIKSPYTLGHSSGVAELAAEAARRCGLPETDALAVRQAGMLHDIGRVGISAGIWGKAGPLSEREWEKVRLHPYYTERVLARPNALGRLGALASQHHERLDGSGYHRGAPAAMLSPSARILAAADVYHALTEPRPHRPARLPDQAAQELHREVRAGRLDGDAVSGVLEAAGHRVRPARRELVAGLSPRELEVLRLLARGHTMQQMAEKLVISRKTVDSHIQNIYIKIGVSTRAGATLFAMEQRLLADEA